jgi:hypothetical protein
MATPLAAAGAGVSAAEDAASFLPAALASVSQRTLATFQEAFTSFAHNGILLRTGAGTHGYCIKQLVRQPVIPMALQIWVLAYVLLVITLLKQKPGVALKSWPQQEN